jgi:hypothetical protein
VPAGTDEGVDIQSVTLSHLYEALKNSKKNLEKGKKVD